MPLLAAAPPPTEADLAAALHRFLARKDCPDYLRDAAEPWLAERPVP